MHRERLRGAPSLASEQVARVEIGDREGIAVLAIAGLGAGDRYFSRGGPSATPEAGR